MDIMGIKFAPLNIPLERRLQTLAVAAAISTLIFSGILGGIILTHLTLYTSYWPIAVMYLIWAYVIDIDTCEYGGRRNEWVRNWAWWKYFRDYFPIRVERVPGVDLDSNRNYFFCCFPHGLLPTAVFSVFGPNTGAFHQLFPEHTPYPLTLKQTFLFPILREIILALGVCSASEKSIRWILGSPEGGKVAALVVGGAAETFETRPGQYRIVLKKRKGFIKLALKYGTPLVPVFSFGETDIYNQVKNPKGSIVREIQEWIKDATGIAPVIPLGRGFFQYSFGIIPFRKPISTIIGKPIEVEKVELPTQEQIDNLHTEFMKKLTELFEEQKHNYLPDAQNVSLIID